MDTKEYIKKVDDFRDELFRLAKMGRQLIESILAEKGNITEEMLYDGEDECNRDWIWLDYKWGEMYGDLRLMEIFKEDGIIKVKVSDDRMNEWEHYHLGDLPPSDIVEIANQLCYIYDRL